MAIRRMAGPPAPSSAANGKQHPKARTDSRAEQPGHKGAVQRERHVVLQAGYEQRPCSEVARVEADDMRAAFVGVVDEGNHETVILLAVGARRYEDRLSRIAVRAEIVRFGIAAVEIDAG